METYTLNKAIKPCPHGECCNNKLNCGYWHNTVTTDQLTMGKSNLLTRAIECMAPFNNFTIKVYPTNNIPLISINQLVNSVPINIVSDRYIYQPNHIYQVFSNKVLGGGTLNHGNVQEEKLMMTTTLLQFLLNGYHKGGTYLANNLEINPIVVDTDIVVKDNSYDGYQNNLCPHYGRKGLMLASDANVANAIYQFIDKPIPIKAICVAVPAFRDVSGTAYNAKCLSRIFQTLYKSFVAAILSDVSSNGGETNIHIGNIGCGAFNHNYNTIMVLQYLAIGCAISTTKPAKKIVVTYHAYDDKTKECLMKVAVPTFLNWCLAGMPVDRQILGLRHMQKQVPSLWAVKL